MIWKDFPIRQVDWMPEGMAILAGGNGAPVILYRGQIITMEEVRRALEARAESQTVETEEEVDNGQES